MSDLSDRVRQRIRDYEAGVGSKVIIIAAEDAIMRFIDEESAKEERPVVRSAEEIVERIQISDNQILMILKGRGVESCDRIDIDIESWIDWLTKAGDNNESN